MNEFMSQRKDDRLCEMLKIFIRVYIYRTLNLRQKRTKRFLIKNMTQLGASPIIKT